MKKMTTLTLAAMLFTALSVFANEPVLKGDIDGDKEALLEIFEALNGTEWVKIIEGDEYYFNWSEDEYVEDFIGVTVEDDRVTALDLKGIENLEGELPAAIGRLDALQKIELSDNLYLTGTLPDEFYNLISLQEIRIANTSIAGPLSDKIGQLTQLVTIFMEKNPYMTGGIPAGIKDCTMLDYIRVADNVRMDGSIPEEIGNCTNLTVFQCERGGKWTGRIPEGFAKLPNLKYLNLNENSFTGIANFCAEGNRMPSTMLEIHRNLIPFGDLLPMKNFTRSATGGWYYRFIEQYKGLKLTKEEIKVKGGESLVLDIDELLPNHGGVTFKWFKDEVEIGTGKKFETTMNEDAAGSYYCEITTDPDILNSGICPNCEWQDPEATINPRPSEMATNTTAVITVAMDSGSGIDELKSAEAVSVINTNDGSFIIKINNDLNNVSYKMININGQVIASGTIKGQEQEITTSVPDGVYVFLFDIHNKTIAKKVVK